MATQIDERVVQMKFNNQQFEQGAKQTMQTMDKLKNSLDMTGAAKGFDQINKVANNIRMDGMYNSLQKIERQFSVVGIAGMTVMNNLVNSAVNAGKSMVEALTIKPVTEGLSEYELKMGSVQTIMASTGASIQEVNGYLEELNTYSDRTIYSFSDMTNSIGKFTNAGVSLKDAVAAIQGISNEAAISGANANEASRAMYNFAQALSTGAVKLIDWKSIENANMATVEFKNQLIETAVEVGTLTKQGDMFVSTTTDMQGKVSDAFNATKSFNDSLSAQWMTTDVLVKTLQKYTDETTELGKKAFAAAQDVKTFSQLMDTLKESVGSGWATTWEIVFGDFEEAKVLWSQVNNVVGDFINTISDSRNNLLRGGLSTGWKNFTRQYVSDAETLKNEIMEVASTQVEEFDKMIEKSGGFEQSLKQGWLTTDIFGTSIENLAKKVSGLSEEQLAEIGFTKEQQREFTGLWTRVQNGTLSIDELVKSLSQMSGRENIIAGLGNAFKAFGTIVKPLADAIGEVFPPLTAQRLYQLTENFKNFTAQLALSGEAMYTLKVLAKAVVLPFKILLDILDLAFYVAAKLALQVWKLLEAFIALPSKTSVVGNAIADAIGNERYNRLANALTKIVQNIGDAFTYVKEQVLGMITSIRNSDSLPKLFEMILNTAKSAANQGLDLIISGLEALGKIDIANIPEVISNGFKKAWASAKEFFSTFTDGGLTKGLDWLIDRFKQIPALFEEATPTAAGFAHALDPVAEAIKKVVGGITTFLGAIRNFISNLTAGKILVFAFGTAVTGAVFEVIKAAEAITEGVSNIMLGFSNVLNNVAMATTRLSTSGANLMDALTKRIKPTLAGQFQKVVITVAGAIVVLVACLGILSSIPTDKLDASVKALEDIMATFALSIAGLMIVFGLLSNTVPGFQSAATSLSVAVGIFGVAMVLLTQSFKTVSEIDTEGIQEKMLAFLEFLVLAIGSMVIIGGKATGGITAAASVLLFSMAIGRIIDSLEKVSKADLSGLSKHFGNLLAAIGLLAKMSKMAKGVKFESAAGLTLLVIDMQLLISTLEKIAKKDMSTILAGMIKMIPVIMTLKLIGKSMNGMDDNASKAGGSILLMSAGLLLIAQAVEQLGKLDIATATKGTLCVSAILAMFGLVCEWSEHSGKYAQKAGQAILFMSTAIMLLQFAVGYLGGMDLPTIVKGMACVEIMLVTMGTLLPKLKGLNKGTGPILALVAVIGILTTSLMLLTMLDTVKLVASSVAISLALDSFGDVMKKVQKMNIKNSIAAVTLLGVMVGIIAGIITAMSYGIKDAESAVASAAGIAAVLIAVGVAADLANNVQIDMTTIGAIGVWIGAISIALIALKDLPDPVSTLANATAISEILIAIGICTKIMNTDLAPNFSQAMTVAAMMGALLLLCATSLVVLKDLKDPVNTLANATALSEILIAVSAAAAILGAIGKFAGTGAIASGAAGMAAVMAVVALLSAAFGKLDADGSFSKLCNDGAKMFAALGTAIGALVGGIIGGIGAGLSAAAAMSIEMLGDALGKFGVSITPFLVAMKMVDGQVVGSVGLLVAAIMALTAADFVSTLSNVFSLFTGRQANFGDRLTEYVDPLISFAQKISQAGIDAEAVQAASALGTMVADLNNSLPRKGGKIEEWFGGKTDLGTFGIQLGLFATAMVMYSTAIAGITNWEDLEKGATIGQTLADLNSHLPASGGVLQYWMGSMNMSTFAQGIADFGEAMKGYSEKIAGIENWTGLEKSATIGQTLADLNNSLPVTGGKLQSWFLGQKDLKSFGENLVTLAQGIVDYNDKISETTINDATVESSIKVAKMVADLDQYLPEKTSLKSVLFGGAADWEGFTSNLQKLGTAIADFANSVNGIDFGGVDPESLMRLAGQGLMTSLGDGIEAKFEEMKNLGHKTGETFANGIKDYTNTMKTQADLFAQACLNQLNTTLGVSSGPSTKSYTMGQNVVQGLINGIKSKTEEAKTAAKTLADAVNTTTSDTYELGSPSKLYYKYGGYIVQGLANGFKDYTPIGTEAAVKMSTGIFEATTDYWEINSPSIKAKDEIGHYIVQGIAEGITEDMSAEEAAKKKGENILAAFQNAMGENDLDKEAIELQDELWKIFNPEPDKEDKEYDEMSYAHQMEVLEGFIKNASEDLKLAEDALGEVQKNAPNDTKLLKQANNEVLKQQKIVAEYAKQIQDLEKEHAGVVTEEDLQKNEQNRKKYLNMLNDPENQKVLQAYLDMGYTIEKWRSDLMKESGYDPDLGKNVEQGIVRSLNEIIEAYSITDETTYEYPVEKAAESGTKKGITNGVTKGAANADLTAAGVATGANMANSLNSPTAQTVIANGASTAIQNGITQGMNQADYSNTPMGLLNGLVEGIGNGSGAVNQAGKALADQFLGGVDSRSGINSPSTEMILRGQYLIEGLAIGINDNAHLAIDAIRTMLETAVLDAVFQGNQFATSFLEGFYQAVDTGEIFSRSLDGLILKVKSIEPQAYSGGMSVGEQLTNGIVQGIQNGMPLITQAAENAAKAAYQAALAALGAGGESGGLTISTSSVPSGGGGGGGGGGGFRASTSISQADQIENDRLYAEAKAAMNALPKKDTSGNIIQNNTFIQNNTSPKALSATDTYRYGKSMFSQAGTSLGFGSSQSSKSTTNKK